MPERRCTVHKLVADVAAISDGSVLLTRYRDLNAYDGQSGWFLPDDYLQFGEHPEDAAKRILTEQVGLEGLGPVPSHIESFGDGAWHLVFHYRVDLAHAPSIRPGKNVADARWFPLDKLPPRKDVAHGGWAIDVLERVLRGRA